MPWSTALSHQGQGKTLLPRYWQYKPSGNIETLWQVNLPENRFFKSSLKKFSSVRHWWPRCKVAAESSRCRKYSSPPPEYHLNYKKYQKHSSSLKTPGRCPPSTPPYQGIRHSRRNSHQIFGIKIKMCKCFSSTFWWSRDRAIWRMVEVWNCSTRFESAKMAKEALDSVATKSFIRLTSTLTWYLSLQLLCGHLGDVISKILKKTLALDLNS